MFSYAMLSSFILCIAALRWYQRPAYPAEAWQLLTLLFLIVMLGIWNPLTKKIGYAGLALAFGIALATGTVARTTHTPAALDIDAYANAVSVELLGTISAEPDKRPLQTKYTVSVHELHTQSGSVLYPVHGKVLATDSSGWPEYKYGDTVLVRGVLEAPGAIETFQYDRYLSRYDVYAVIYHAGFSLQHTNNTFSLRRMLFGFKERFEAQINKLYSEPHASFMAGLLTGSRKGIPLHLLEDFNTTGLTHIIAISGYNITIIITVISGMLFWLPIKIRFFPAVASIVIFTIFVGASAAVVRASIMGILGLLALQTGRQSDVRLTVLWTLALMLLWNPKYLWYDAGFQLSYLAVLGIVELSPMLQPMFARVPQMLGMREALQMTIAAQLSAVPFIVLLFGRLSFIAPVANLVVAPLLPLAMLFGFTGTMLSFVCFPLGQLVAYMGWGCLEWIIQTATLLANLPVASADFGTVRPQYVVLYYLCMCLPLIHAQFSFSRQPRN